MAWLAWSGRESASLQVDEQENETDLKLYLVFSFLVSLVQLCQVLFFENDDHGLTCDMEQMDVLGLTGQPQDTVEIKPKCGAFF